MHSESIMINGINSSTFFLFIFTGSIQKNASNIHDCEGWISCNVVDMCFDFIFTEAIRTRCYSSNDQ